MTLGKKWVLLVPTVILAVTAFVAWPYLPKRYQSETTLMVVPQRVAESYVRATIAYPLEGRLQTIQQRIMSRTRLERVIDEFTLYVDDRRRLPMEDVVERMRRRDIRVETVKGDAFKVSFIADNPRTAMHVTERLATLFINESLQDRQMVATATSDFLRSQADAAHGKLVDHWKKQQQARGEGNALVGQELALEEEVLRATYKSLLAKLADADLAAALEQRQIGETFRMIDPPRLPERPLSPTRLGLTFVGGVAGLCLGVVLVLVSAARRAALARRPKS